MEYNEEVDEIESGADGQEVQIQDTDIVFDCPHCGHNLCIDYRGAGLQITCSECGEPVLVPIPDGMKISDLDLDASELLKQLFATRRLLQRAEARVEALSMKIDSFSRKLGELQEALSTES
jgi:transcription elongation factor Elf1